MAVEVTITPRLLEEISQQFRRESLAVIDHLHSLKQSPHKGKIIGSVRGVVIKELKFRGFRFYFLADGHKMRCMLRNEVVDLLFRFVRMSGKKDQQQKIDEIRHILASLGSDGF